MTQSQNVQRDPTDGHKVGDEMRRVRVTTEGFKPDESGFLKPNLMAVCFFFSFQKKNKNITNYIPALTKCREKHKINTKTDGEMLLIKFKKENKAGKEGKVYHG